MPAAGNCESYSSRSSIRLAARYRLPLGRAAGGRELERHAIEAFAPGRFSIQVPGLRVKPWTRLSPKSSVSWIFVCTANIRRHDDDSHDRPSAHSQRRRRASERLQEDPHGARQERRVAFHRSWRNDEKALSFPPRSHRVVSGPPRGQVVSVFKRKDSPFYYCEFQIDGRRVFVSTKTGNRK